MSRYSLEDRQAQLEKIASYELKALERGTAKELRSLAKGVIPNYTKLTKPELFQALVDATADIRLAKRLEIEQKEAATQEQLLRQQEEALKLNLALQKTPEMDELRDVQRQGINPDRPEDRGHKIFDSLEAIANTSKDLTVLKDRVTELVLQQVTLETSCYAPTTRKSNKTAIKTVLQERLNQRQGNLNHSDLATAVAIFSSAFDAALRVEGIVISKEYKADVAERNRELTPVSGMALLQKAASVLNDLTNGANVRWQDVSIALTLATGRRMAEIHATASFNAVDDSTIEFQGQTKARHDQEAIDRPYPIPSLLNAGLVARAIDWLASNGYRVNDQKAVNSRFAKPLQRQLEAVWFPIAGKKLTYKDLRAIYAQIATDLYKPSNMSQPAYLAKILGHSESDIVTALSYQKFEIIDL